MPEHRRVQHDCTWLLLIGALCVVAAVTLATIQLSPAIVARWPL